EIKAFVSFYHINPRSSPNSYTFSPIITLSDFLPNYFYFFTQIPFVNHHFVNSFTPAQLVLQRLN
ncbi:hypothetical protein RZS08_07400, partial [Arthrospira platensis SPKY1]|nr:hypothetical protein [Arthrospira platensis SPKY1]